MFFEINNFLFLNALIEKTSKRYHARHLSAIGHSRGIKNKPRGTFFSRVIRLFICHHLSFYKRYFDYIALPVNESNGIIFTMNRLVYINRSAVYVFDELNN